MMYNDFVAHIPTTDRNGSIIISDLPFVVLNKRQYNVTLPQIDNNMLRKNFL